MVSDVPEVGGKQSEQGEMQQGRKTVIGEGGVAGAHPAGVDVSVTGCTTTTLGTMSHSIFPFFPAGNISKPHHSLLINVNRPQSLIRCTSVLD